MDSAKISNQIYLRADTNSWYTLERQCFHLFIALLRIFMDIASIIGIKD